MLRELRIPLSSEQIHQLELQRRATEDADAYRAYLRGRYDWNQRTEDGLRRAMGTSGAPWTSIPDLPPPIPGWQTRMPLWAI